jgi:hypothetical protein
MSSRFPDRHAAGLRGLRRLRDLPGWVRPALFACLLSALSYGAKTLVRRESAYSTAGSARASKSSRSSATIAAESP